MEKDKTKCALCGIEITEKQQYESKKGLICNKCHEKIQKQKKIRNTVLVLISVAVIAGAFFWLRKDNVKSFGGIKDIDDEVVVQMQEVETFELSKATPVSSPTKVSEAINDIKLFKEKVENSINNANASEQTITIPSIVVLFDLNSWQVSNTSELLLKEFAELYCKTNMATSILADGYTCDLGSNRHNMELSKNRAAKVKEYLVACGVPADKVEIAAHGEDMYGKLDLTKQEDYRRVNITVK